MTTDWIEEVVGTFLSLEEYITETLGSDTALSQGRMLLGKFRPGLRIFHDVTPTDLPRIQTIATLALAADLIVRAGASIASEGYINSSKLEKAFPLVKLLAKAHTSCLDRYSQYADLQMEEFLSFLSEFLQDKGWFGGYASESETAHLGAFLCGICSILRASPKALDEYEALTTTIFHELMGEDEADYRQHEVFQSNKNSIATLRSTVALGTQSIAQPQQKKSNQAASYTGVASASQAAKVEPPLASSLPAGLLQNPELALKEALADLDALIGLAGVKAEIRKLMSFLKIQQERRKHGLRESSQTLHFVFTGNPGTGKTSVARIVSKIMFGFGILQTTNVVECSRSDLVGGFLGQTAIKTDEKITAALDGVLFIDEAYTLSGDDFGRDMYGQEAIDQLLKRMEDYRDRLVVIVAGYPRPMEKFLKTNPGLESRFTRFIRFEDYQVPHLCRIFDKFTRDADYALTPLGRAMACLLFTVAYNRRDERFGNGRFVRNEFEKALSLHSQRLVGLPDHEISKEVLMTLDGPDIPFDSVSDLDLGEVDLQEAKWEAECPGCGKITRAGVKFLGMKVSCKCSKQFV